MRLLENRYMKKLMLVIAIILINIAVISFAEFDISDKLTLQYGVQASQVDVYQMFYGEGDEWIEENSSWIEYLNPGVEETLTFDIPKETKAIRLDLGNKIEVVELNNLTFKYLWKEIRLDETHFNYLTESNDIEVIESSNSKVRIQAIGEDPYFILSLETLEIPKLFNLDKQMNNAFKILVCIMTNLLIVIFMKKRGNVRNLMRELITNRKLLCNLAKNDFKTKYAGSYLGIIWAFVHPIVTVLVYWFVFEVGFKSAPVEDFPFLLWLVSGLVPWFFFSEAIINATNSMVEYSYLVKKVVFKISILPIVKIISALFVHVFFVIFTIVLFAAYGHLPTVYTLQVVYYTMCMFILVLGLSYATSAIIIFFKDLGQIISIFLQVGMWMTPIMWSYNMVPAEFQWILKLNPMYYIIEGYRDSLINHVWFWERFNQTIYFWLITIGMFGIGALIFKRLKVHFADVL